MTLAHIRNNILIRTYQDGKGRVTLANGDTVSPPVAGYVNGTDRIVPVVEETVDTSKTHQTETTVTETVEADRLYRLATISDLPFADRKAAKIDALAAKRWRVETGGIAVNGVTVASDRESQGLIDGAARLASREPNETIKFKTSAGWATLDAATMDDIAVAVGRHIRKCFAREAELSSLIEAAQTQQELDNIDIETGWPI